jgi:predicted small metal-binding protein
MKTLACGDLVPGCKATFQGKTEDDILQQAGKHAVEAHGVPVTPDLVEAVKKAIKEDGK